MLHFLEDIYISPRKSAVKPGNMAYIATAVLEAPGLQSAITNNCGLVIAL